MLGEEKVKTGGFGAAGKVVEGGVAFAEGDYFFEVVDDGQKIAKAPDARLVDGHCGRAALLPEPAEGAGVGEQAVRVGRSTRSGRGFSIRPCVDDLVKTVALRAAEVAADLILCDDGGAFCASKVMCRYFHGSI
jgi:hypothetical protein